MLPYLRCWHYNPHFLTSALLFSWFVERLTQIYSSALVPINTFFGARALRLWVITELDMKVMPPLVNKVQVISSVHTHQRLLGVWCEERDLTWASCHDIILTIRPKMGVEFTLIELGYVYSLSLSLWPPSQASRFPIWLWGILCHTAAHNRNYFLFFPLSLIGALLNCCRKTTYQGFLSWMVTVYLYFFQSFCTQVKKKRGERWVQTFLVVKGRNLQLSNKSLRLDPRCHWLPLTTWRTLYEHELYAVVYSLVLPLYQQQT